MAERIADADIVITNKAPVRRGDRWAREACGWWRSRRPAPTWSISRPARARGIAVSNIRNYAVNTVPEHTFALILALRRSILAYRESVDPRPLAGGGAVLLLRLPDPRPRRLDARHHRRRRARQGRRRARAAFGMQVLFSTYKGISGMGPLYTPFEEVMRTSDVITLHSPLMPSTRNLIAEREFAADGAPAAAHQHRPRRAGRRGGAGRRRWTRGRSPGPGSTS